MAHVLERRALYAAPIAQPFYLNQAQIQQDQLLKGFVRETSDWKNLSAMMAGGLAYRLGKAGMYSLGGYCHTPLVGKILAPVIGLATEVSAFRQVHNLLQSHVSPLLSPSSWFTDYLNFGILKLFGYFGKNHNLLFQNFIQDFAMVAGHQLSYSLKITSAPEGSLAEQLIHAASTNLAMSAGMSLGHYITGGKIHLHEHRLDLSSNCFSKSSASLSAHQKTSQKLFVYHSETTRSLEEILSSWLPRFRPRYEQDDYRREIIRSIWVTSFDRPEHLDYLLEAFSKKGNAGTLDQLYLARSIEHLFRLSPLNNSTGSMENVFLHHLLREALGDHEHLRDRRLARVLQVIEAGSRTQEVLKLIDEFGYSNFFDLPKEGEAYLLRSPETVVQEAAEWDVFYSFSEQRILHHFIDRASQGNSKVARKMVRVFLEAPKADRYPEREIHRVLSYAANHPLGYLILQRIFHVFAVQDSIWKLREIGAEYSGSDGILTIYGTLESGASPDLLAHLINETRTTAYIKDERLARKLISVMEETSPMLDHPGALRTLREKVMQRVWTVLAQERPIGIHDLVWIMEANPSAQLEAFKKAVLEEHFEIRILPESEFKSLRDSFSLPEETAHSFFILNPEGPQDLIIVKALPQIELSDSSAKVRAAHEMIVRIIALLHEWEHWRHSSGNFDGIEAGASPLQISTFHRHDRIVSEVMASLEEERWRNLNFDIETWRMAALLGENPVMYFRNLADESYYARRNQRILNEIFEP